MATPVAALIVRVAADLAELKGGVSQINETMGGMAAAAKGMASALAGAFSFRDIAAGVAQVANAAGQIADSAAKIGIGAEAVQRLQFAAEQSGASIDTVAGAIKNMASHIVEGDDGALAAMQALNLNLDDLRAMSPDQAFTAIAEAIRQVPDPMKQSALAVDLFGRSGAELLPAIKAGIEEVGAAAPVMRDRTVQALDESADKWDQLQGKLNALKAEALTPLVDAFLALPESMQVVAGGITAFLPSIESIGLAVMAAGGPTAALGLLKAAAVGVATFFTATLPAAFSAVLPFLGPVGWIAAGVTAVWAAWKYWDEIVAFFQGAWQYVVEQVQQLPEWLLALTGPIGGVILVFRHWDEIVDIAKRVYEGIKGWLVDKFTGIVDFVGDKVRAVTGFFGDMYEAVVGGSYVPAMVDGIAQEFHRLPAVMVAPARAATLSVQDAFAQMADNLMVELAEIAKAREAAVLAQQASFQRMTEALLVEVEEIARTELQIVAETQAAIGLMIDALLVEVGEIERAIMQVAETTRAEVGTMIDALLIEMAEIDRAAVQMATSAQAEIGAMIDNLLIEIQEIDRTTAQTSVNWQGHLKLMADALGNLGEIGAGVIGSLARGFGTVVASVNAGVESVKALGSGMGQMTSGGGLSSILGGFASMATGIGGLVSAASAAWSAIRSIGSAISGAFRGGEEGTQVNPARDAFFSQFVARHGGSPYEAMASAFTAAGVSGDVAERLIGMLYAADTMDEFNLATGEIRRLLPGYRTGTGGGFVDFGAGTPVMLHGRERVMTEAEGWAEAGLAGEMRALRSDLMRAIDTVKTETIAAAHIARGRGMSYA
jgi:hypothetical protein